MDLFTPVVPEVRQHRNFRTLCSRLTPEERRVFQQWSEGFVDRDGKFVKEFQTTFNSSFWELYLHAAFSELEFTMDYSVPSPDFICSSASSAFVAEAAIASNAVGFAAEWQSSPVATFTIEQKSAMLEYATVRLANAFDVKLEKYRSGYKRLAHVKGKPFIVCLAPFEQPYSYIFAERAVRRLLYSYDLPVYLDDEEKQYRIILGHTMVEQAWKNINSTVRLGLFNSDVAKEVSAVIYSNVASLGKLQAQAQSGPFAFFSALRYNDAGLHPTQIRVSRECYHETLLDGLHIFLNPHAAIPMDPTAFLGREIAVHHGLSEDSNCVRSTVPDGFLISRSVLSVRIREPGDDNEKKTKADEPSSVQQSASGIEPWPNGELRFVGGQNGPFANNHLGHYNGWTMLISECQYDHDWSYIAVRGIYRDVSSFVQANQKSDLESILSPTFLPSRSDALAAAMTRIDNADNEGGFEG